MKTVKKICFLVAICLVICTISSCNKNKIGFEVEETNITIAVGEVYEFKPTLKNVTNPNYAFSISASGIVQIAGRQFKGLKPGVCEVTVSLRDYPKVKSVTLVIEVVENNQE